MAEEDEPVTEDEERPDVIVAGAVGPHHTGTDAGSWDGPAAVRRMGPKPSAAQIRAEFAWVPDDEVSKSAACFPHHDVGSNGSIGAANLRACSAGIAVLNGGRGGTTIPDADKAGVFAHLKTHLTDGGRTAKALAASAEEEPMETDTEDQAPESVEEPVEPQAEAADDYAEVSEAALVAAAIAVPAEPVTDLFNPPAAWFADPQLDRPTHFRVEPEGRVVGHLARWDTPHIGIRDREVRPPRSSSNYAYFRTGTRRTPEGTVPTGPITLGTGHAPLNADASAAAEHYDNTGSAMCDVVVGEDDYGIWVAGALRPGVDPERVLALAASDVSGDWREINGALELVGILSVNVAGFPVAALAASGVVMPSEFGYRAGMRSGSVVSLVPAGILESDPRGDEVRSLRAQIEAWRPVIEALRPLANDRLVAAIAS